MLHRTNQSTTSCSTKHHSSMAHQQQYPTVKPKAITKQQLTTAPSLVHWKQVYAPLVPAFQQHLAASRAAAAAAAADNDASSNNTNNTGNGSNESISEDDIIRYLAEVAGDVNKAVAHHLDTLAWRKATFPIPRAAVLPTIRTGKLLFLGFDRVGRPVCYYRTKLHDPKAFTPEETVKAVVYLYEELQEMARQPGFQGIKEEVCVVVDRTDAKPSNFDVEFVQLFIDTFKKRYPSRLECFLIPSNLIFRGIWALVRPFLDAKSRGSAYLLHSKQELLDFIAEDQLAVFLGGQLPYEPKPIEAEAGGDETKEEQALIA